MRQAPEKHTSMKQAPEKQTTSRKATITHTPILIVGGGIAGLTMACMLAKKGINATLCDALPPPHKQSNNDQRTTALMHTSVALYKNLGIWEALHPYGCPLRAMRLLDTPTPHTITGDICFDSAHIDQDFLAYNVDNHALRTALCYLLSQYDCVTHLFETPVQSIEKNPHAHAPTAPKMAVQDASCYRVHTAEGTYTADLLVGTDGRHSLVREGGDIAVSMESLDEVAVVCNVSHDALPDHTSTEFMYPEGAFTFIPMPDSISISDSMPKPASSSVASARNDDGTTLPQSAIVWIESPETAEKYVKNIPLLQEKIQEKSQGVFGAVTLSSPVQSFPLSRVMAKDCYRQGLCIIAEAHHGLTPVAAQGLNLSLRDGAVLAEILHTAVLSGVPFSDISLLRRYSKKRMLDIRTRDMGTMAFHTLSRFHPSILEPLRRRFFKALAPSRKVKELLIRIGLSFPGGVPKFMQKDTPL